MRSKKRLLFQSLVCIASAFLARGCAVTSIMEHVASVSVPHNPSQEWRETQFFSDCPRLGNNFSFHLFDFEHQAWFCDMKTDILIGSKTYPVDMIGTGEILYLGVSIYRYIYLRDILYIYYLFNNLDSGCMISVESFISWDKLNSFLACGRILVESGIEMELS